MADNQSTRSIQAAQPINDSQSIDDRLRAILRDILGLDPEHLAQFDRDTGLFGHLPELDSMAVAGLLTEMEDRFSITIEDDDVDAEMLETYGALLDFTEARLVVS